MTMTMTSIAVVNPIILSFLYIFLFRFVPLIAKAIDLEDSDEEQPAPKQTEEFSLPRETKSSGPATGILI